MFKWALVFFYSPCLPTLPLHQENADRLMCWNRLKGALCSFGEENQTQNLYVYDINEVVIPTSSSFLEVNKQALPRGKEGPQNTVWRLQRWQGPPHMNRTSRELCCPVRSVCSFRQFVLLGLIKHKEIRQWRSFPSGWTLFPKTT